MFRMLIVVFAMIVGGGDLLQAQDRGRPGDGDPGPVLFLLEFRRDLRLSGEQVARLEQIHLEMEQVNLPLVARMTAIRTRIHAFGRPDEVLEEDRAEYESHLGEVRAVMEQIRTNNKSAMQEVGEVLTDRQKTRLARLLQERDDNRERSGDLPRYPGSGR